MAAPVRDPNRYAYGTEAASLRARIAMEHAEVELLQRHLNEAQTVEADAEARFREVEARYHHLLHLRDDAVLFSATLQRRLLAQTQALSERRRLLHPERKLPPEILGYIFENCSHCVPEAYGHAHTSAQAILARQVQPFRLAAVCRRWRRASLGHPRAWSHIELCIDAVDEENDSSWVDFLDNFLQRSAAVPLTLGILRERHPDDIDNDLIEPLSRVMLRCCTLQVILWHILEGDPMLSILSSQAPQLEGAILSVAYSHGDNAITSLFPLRNSPILSMLLSAGLVIDGCAELPSLSRAILMSPHCTADRDDISHIVTVAPVLETLEISAPVISRDTPPAGLVISATLATLVLTVFDDAPIQWLAYFVLFPNLSSLTLCGNDASAPQLFGLIQSEAESWKLTLLRLVYIGSCELLLPILPRLKYLECLRIEHTAFTAAAWRSFCEALVRADADGSWPCNQLVTIAFARCRFDADCVAHHVPENWLKLPRPSEDSLSLQNLDGFSLVLDGRTASRATNVPPSGMDFISQV